MERWDSCRIAIVVEPYPPLPIVHRRNAEKFPSTLHNPRQPPQNLLGGGGGEHFLEWMRSVSFFGGDEIMALEFSAWVTWTSRAIRSPPPSKERFFLRKPRLFHLAGHVETTDEGFRGIHFEISERPENIVMLETMANGKLTIPEMKPQKNVDGISKI